MCAMTDLDVRVLVDRYRAGWFGHDVDAVIAGVSDDIVFHNVTAQERVEGAAAFRAHVVAIHDRWPDLAFEEHALYLAHIPELRNGLLGGQRRTGGAWSGTDST